MLTVTSLLLLLHSIMVTPTVVAFPVAVPSVAQGTQMGGEWRVTWDSDVKSSGGVVQRVNRRSTAQLILSEQVDSVQGRWIDGLLNDTSSSPGVAVRGVVHGDTLILTTGNINASRGKVRVSLHGVRSGTTLRGTMYVESPGLPPVPRKWEAERVTPR